MPELTEQQRWSYRVLASTMPVLRLLNDLARPATCAEIAMILDITPKTAQRYLNNLEYMHFIARLPETRSYYAIVELETLLAADLPAEPPQDEVPEPAPGEPELLPGSPAVPDSARALLEAAPVPAEEKILPPGEAVVAVKSLKINTVNYLTATTAAPRRGKFFSHPGQPGAFPWLAKAHQAAGEAAGDSPPDAPPENAPPPSAPPPIPEDTRQALVAAGIGEPKRSQIARLPHITPAYVRAWSAYLETSGKPRSSGLLVYLLEQGDPLPEYAGKIGPDGEFHLKGCKCKFCTWGRLLCPDCLEYPCQCEFVCEDCGEDPCTCDDPDAVETAALPAEDTADGPAEPPAEGPVDPPQEDPVEFPVESPAAFPVDGGPEPAQGGPAAHGTARAGSRPPPRGDPHPGGHFR